MSDPISPPAYDLDQLGYDRVDETAGSATHRFVWAHGWGQDRKAMQALAQSLFARGVHDFIDLPGFGASPRPDQTWTTADYADAAARWLEQTDTGAPVVWIGHSFGCRVGLQLAARHPDAVSAMLLIAAAGLPRKRSALETAKFKGRVYGYKALKRLAPLAGISQDQLRERFGSADYRSAGALRDIFLNVVNEDLSDVAARVACPVHLIYGAGDTETPPEIGERLARLIRHAKLTVLDGFDHYTILTDGRHQVARRLKSLIGG